MADDSRERLRQHFGFDDFRPGQRRVVEALLGGHSTAAVFPTGAGKSLCYQLPALMLPGITLVVSPLIALMKDQIDALAKRGIAACRLDSTLDAEQYRQAITGVRDGTLKLLYVAPERFNNELFRESILRARISLMAVDEAHCISEWGHNFRPDYLKLATFARTCGAERVLALTATATRRVLDDICRAFEIDPAHAVNIGFYRENLTLLTTPVTVAHRDAHLLSRLRDRAPGPTIVYVTLQRTAEEVAERLSAAGLPARPYHAGMKDDQRAAIQDWFIGSERGIVVATIAFGMGIDKADIRYVYHYNLPKSLESYSQEIGRSGRDGETAICEILACPDDLNVLENFVYGDTPTKEAVRTLLGEVFSHDVEFDVSNFELSAQHDIRILVVRTLLTYLELDGYLEGGTPFYSEYQFQPLLSLQEILEKFDEPRRQFLTNLFHQAHKAKKWHSIDLDDAARRLDQPRQRLVRALDYLGEQGMVELKAAGVRNRYRRLEDPGDLDVLADRLYQLSLSREQREIGRLRQVLEWVQRDACQVSALCEHFDAPLDTPCGHCSWCATRQRVQLPSRQLPSFPDSVWNEANRLRSEHPEILGHSVALTRFLCGISSPKLIRAKMTAHPLYGQLSGVPFRDVLARVSQL